MVKGIDGGQQLYGSNIYCPQNGDCEIQCRDEGTSTAVCRYMNVYAQGNTTLLSITSYGSRINSLRNMNIYCPPSMDGYTPRCIINILSSDDDGNTLSNTNIYAIQGLNDIDIKCNYSMNALNSSSCYSNNNNPIIHCTENYQQNCSLLLMSGYSDWECQNGDNDICNDYAPGLSILRPLYMIQNVDCCVYT